VIEKLREYFRTAKDFCVYQILHADDPPHRLALGIAVGIFVTFTPLMGIQMLLSVFLAWLLKANKVVGVPIVWISNPLTFIPIYYPCYALGCKLLATPVYTWQEFTTLWQAVVDPNKSWGEKVRFGWDSLVDFIGPLFLGCLIVATIAGLLTYYISLFAIRQYRLARWGQLMPPRTSPPESIDDNAVTQDESATGDNAA
jgi:uncharacterized protein (DUF2062 family)